MNITEANAFNALLRGLTPGATDDTMHHALEAAQLLGDRAHAAVHAGADGRKARELVDANFTVLVWGEEADPVTLGPDVQTVAPAGGVL